MRSTLQHVVQAADLDDLGHVNNARFLEYLERGREHWYTSSGVWEALAQASHDTGAGHPPGARAVQARLGTVVVNIVVNFRRELLADDRLSITTRPLRKRRTAYVLSQAIRNQAGELVCDAEVTCVVMDLVSRRAVPLPEAFGRRMQGPPPDRADTTITGNPSQGESTQ